MTPLPPVYQYSKHPRRAAPIPLCHLKISIESGSHWILLFPPSPRPLDRVIPSITTRYRSYFPQHHYTLNLSLYPGITTSTRSHRISASPRPLELAGSHPPSTTIPLASLLRHHHPSPQRSFDPIARTSPSHLPVYGLCSSR